MKYPMETLEIVPGVHWVGVKDWDREMFDRLIPLPRGTSYNSYLFGKLLNQTWKGIEKDGFNRAKQDL